MRDAAREGSAIPDWWRARVRRETSMAAWTLVVLAAIALVTSSGSLDFVGRGAEDVALDTLFGTAPWVIAACVAWRVLGTHPVPTRTIAVRSTMRGLWLRIAHAVAVMLVALPCALLTTRLDDLPWTAGACGIVLIVLAGAAATARTAEEELERG